MKKDKLAWFKNNKVQIDWACKYLQKPRVVEKLNVISGYRPTNDNSTYKGIIGTLTYLESNEYGSEFIRVMANTWTKTQSEMKDPRKSLHIKVAQDTYKNLKFLIKNSEYNNSEFIELLINVQADKLNKVTKEYEDKIERLKRKHTNDILKIKSNYNSGDVIPKARYDEINHELTKTKDVLVKISETITKLK
jgi:hypothetical protein